MSATEFLRTEYTDKNRKRPARGYHNPPRIISFCPRQHDVGNNAIAKHNEKSCPDKFSDYRVHGIISSKTKYRKPKENRMKKSEESHGFCVVLEFWGSFGIRGS